MSRISTPFPARVGYYELLAPIGAGGMATVYLGVSTSTSGVSRHVAVKMIHGTADADSQLAHDLLKEARLVAQIRHPNVVPVLDVGEDPNGLFLVMEYIEGDNFAALRRAAKRAGETIPEPIALRIVTDALAGLAAAHDLKDANGASLGVVHRDFSPHNIMVGTDGVSRLTDFGIAKVAYTGGHTRTGRIKGKIAYMAPEQARGGKVDQRCDVWAAGVVAWEAVVGERLYDTDDEIGALLRIVNEDPPRLRDARPDLPPELDEAMHWALTRDLPLRCPSADALRRRFLSASRIADTAEVAEFVRRIIGPKLIDRQARIEKIRRRRGHVDAPATAERSGSLPAFDLVSDAFSEPAETSEREERPATSREDTTGATIAWKEQAESGGAPPPGGVITGSVERSIAGVLADRRKRAAIIGVASGLGIGGVLISVIFIAVGSRSAPNEIPASSAPPASLVPLASTPAAAPPGDPPPPATAIEPKDQPFTIKANGDIASLKVGSDLMLIKPPTSDVGLAERPKAGVAIEAVAADGRRARSTIPEQGDSLTLDFGRRPVSGGNVKPSSPFADNPYKKK
ncbi:MAG: serine/threonine-protein kinase [Polyangiaceae bacterium]